jgi:hypothetical protein
MQCLRIVKRRVVEGWCDWWDTLRWFREDGVLLSRRLPQLSVLWQGQGGSRLGQRRLCLGQPEGHVHGPVEVQEEAAVGHLLRQGMLEGLGGLGDKARFIEELGHLQLQKHPPQLVLVLDLPAAQHASEFPNRSRCVYVERSPGQLMSGEMAQPVEVTESCVRHDGTIGYDPSSHHQAVEAVKAFLTATFERNARALSMTDALRPRQSR